MYRKALQSFFLKVHPDFFAADPAKQKVNESSIAQLNELLGWAKEFKAGTMRPPPSTQQSYTFYQQIDTNNNNSAEGLGGDSSVSTSPPSKQIFPLIQCKFELPATFAATENHRGVAERSVNRFLRDLLRHAGCIDGVTESLSAAEDATAERNEAKPVRKRPQVTRQKQKSKPKSLLDAATESLRESWKQHETPTMDELMDADQIFFSRSLSPLQSAAAMNTLRECLPEMLYYRWQSTPLLITDRFAVGEIGGTISVPWDFQLTSFLAFLNKHDAALAINRKQTEQFAKRIEVLIAEIGEDLKVDDVLISCAHKDALPCLELLHRHRDLLSFHQISEVTLEIGSKFATRANGVVVVPFSMTKPQLESWVRAVQPRMAMQKKLYRLSKSMLESTTWHLQEVRTSLRPAGIDAFDNENTYAERLQWAKELFRISSVLAQWDWSDVTFSLGPLQLDWDQGIICVPHNFAGDSLVRYVEEVHRDAKKRKRDALLEQSAMAKEEATQRAAEQANPEHMEQQLQLEFHPSNAVQRSVVDGESDSNKERETAAAQRLRHTNPHLEEYMASSSDRVDALSVERPLAHSVSFASDEEAEDQLKWEGFYDDPYTDQRPESDIDDLSHAYFASNRWHREKAAQKVLEELRSKYGKNSKRFEHLKMGDLLGVNDPKVQPKGFPILAKGLRPGASS